MNTRHRPEKGLGVNSAQNGGEPLQKPYSIKLDLYHEHTRNTPINYVVADAETMPLHIQLLADNAPYGLPASAIIELNFENPKGLRFPRDGIVEDHEQGQILYNIQSSDIAIDGQMVASVTVVNGTERLTWQSFGFRVLRNLSDSQVEPPDIIGPWQGEIEEKLSEHEGQLAGHAGQLTNHAAQLADHESRIVALEEAETNIEVDLTDIEARLVTAEAGLTTAQATATDARNIANNAAGMAATAGIRAEEGISKADNAQADVDALTTRVTTLEQNSALDTDLTDLKSAVAALQSQLNALQAESTAKWVLLNTVDNRSRANGTSITALDGRVTALEQG